MRFLHERRGVSLPAVLAVQGRRSWRPSTCPFAGARRAPSPRSQQRRAGVRPLYRMERGVSRPELDRMCYHNDRAMNYGGLVRSVRGGRAGDETATCTRETSWQSGSGSSPAPSPSTSSRASCRRRVRPAVRRRSTATTTATSSDWNGFGGGTGFGIGRFTSMSWQIVRGTPRTDGGVTVMSPHSSPIRR